VSAFCFQRGDPTALFCAPCTFNFSQRIAGHDGALAFGEFQHVFQLVAAGAWIDRHKYSAQYGRGHHQVDELGVVLHDDAELVTLLHTL
jgi:hypothetical protein